MFLLWILVLIGIPIVLRLRSRMAQLEDRVARQQNELEALSARLRLPRNDVVKPTEGEAKPKPVEPKPEAPPVVAKPVAPPPPIVPPPVVPLPAAPPVSSEKPKVEPPREALPPPPPPRTPPPA